MLILNMEALKAFLDTITIAKREPLACERAKVKEWLDQGGLDSTSPPPWGETTYSVLEYANYEHLKIAAGFELHLKARLLARNYIVHKIDDKQSEYKYLAQQQKNRPIKKTEIFAIKNYHFNGEISYLPGIKNTTINFSSITNNQNYNDAVELTKPQINLIEHFRELRNEIHFPMSAHSISISINGENENSITETLINFINDEIIEPTNIIIDKYELPIQNIPREAPFRT